jgi:hypothetical protein
MADFFGRATDVNGGTFAAEMAKVTFAQNPDFPGGGLGRNSFDPDPAEQSIGVAMLAQSLQFAYQQCVTRVYVIGTTSSFKIASRAQGSAGLGRVLGPRPVALAFYQKYGDVRNAASNSLNIEMSAGCKAVDGFTQRYAFGIETCVIVSIGVSVAAQDMMINEQVQLTYASLRGMA